MTLTAREAAEVARVNGSGRQPVVLVHGLWMLPSSWDRWVAHLEARGFAALAADWPGDPATVEEARAHGEVYDGLGVAEVADHLADVVGALDRRPVVIGHSFGGLFAQVLAGRGLALASVAIDPAPFRGVLPLPFSALKASFPVLGNPRNRKGHVMLTPAQFRYGFTNAVDDAEADELYATYAVPAPGRPLFQAATANLDPRTAAKVDTRHPDRGPLLVVSGGSDNIVPWAIANAAYKQQRRNAHPTEIVEIDGVGHSLVIDSGWEKVAQTALDFLGRHGVTA